MFQSIKYQSSSLFFVNPLFTTVLVCCWLFHTVERKEIFFINHHHSSCSTTTTNSVDPPLWQIASFTRPVFYSYLSDFYHPNVRMYGDGPIIIHLHHRHPQTHQCWVIDVNYCHKLQNFHLYQPHLPSYFHLS